MLKTSIVYRYGLSVALMLTVQTIFGGYSILAHVALSGTLHPLVFALVRDTLGTLCLMGALYIKCRGMEKADFTFNFFPKVEEFPRLMLCGVCGVWASQAGSALTLKNLDPTTMSLLQPLMPLVTALGSLIAGYEVWRVGYSTAGKVLGLALSVGGASYISFASTASKGGKSTAGNVPVGLLFLSIQIVGGGLYSVFQKPLLAERPSMFVATWGYALGWCILLLCTLSGCTSSDDWVFTPASAGAAVYAGILSSAYCYAAMAHAVQLSSPLFMAGFFPFMPLATVLLVWVSGGGLPSLNVALGGLACGLGLAVFTAGQALGALEEHKRIADSEGGPSVEYEILRESLSTGPLLEQDNHQ